MNSLPGNPHQYEASTDAPNCDHQVAQALLALAHEKRIENLNAWRRHLCSWASMCRPLTPAGRSTLDSD